MKDGGIRFTRFGNNAGGSWIGDYRYVLIEDQNKNNQIISLSVIGQMKVEDHPMMFGNTKGHSFLIVAIDDFDKSHNSLQLILDRFTEKDGTSYTITHNGKLANGNKGTASQAAVINFVREHAPELLDENDRVFLGKFDHTRNIVFSDENMKIFLGKVIKYALARDEFRKASN